MPGVGLWCDRWRGGSAARAGNVSSVCRRHRRGGSEPSAPDAQVAITLMMQNQRIALRIVRLPVAAAVGYGSGWVVQQVLGLDTWFTFIVSAVIFMVILRTLSRTVYRRLTPRDADR